MSKKIIGIFVCTLLITTAIPSIGMINQKSITDNNYTDSEPLVLPHERIYIIHHLMIRNYLLYVPTSYDGTEPVPLVVVFHGGGNTPENASGRYGVSEKAEEEGFIVVYPNATKLMGDMWHFGLGWYTSTLMDEIGRWFADEIGYTKKIIEKTQKDYNIDPDRIYLAGHSNGAMMAYYFAAEFSDIIAAAASNAGAIGGHIPDFDMVMIPEPENPVSIIILHGKKDKSVPYNGGWYWDHTSYYTSVADAVDFWVENNGCNPDPVTNTIGNVTIDRYSGGDAGTEVVLYTIENKGHIWFGGPAWEDPNPEVSTTDEMWDFFEAHPKQ